MATIPADAKEPSNKVNVKKIFQIAMENFKRAEMGRQSAELAYYVLLSLFPVLLALGNVIPLLPIPSEQIINYVELAVPEELAGTLVPILQNYLEGGNGGAITIGVIVSIWTASKAFAVFQRVLNQVYDADAPANFIVARIISFVVALLLVSVIAVVALIFVFGREILELVQNLFDINLLNVITTFEYFRWIVAGLVIVALVAFIYFAIPNVRWHFKYAIPGAIVATIGFLLISQLFSLYVRFAGGQAIGNGAIGGFIVLMLWLYLLGNVFIFGGIVNSVIHDYIHRDEIVFNDHEAYVSVVYSDNAKLLMAKEVRLRRTLLKENPAIKEDHLPGQDEPLPSE